MTWGVPWQQLQKLGHQRGVWAPFWVTPILIVSWDQECKLRWLSRARWLSAMAVGSRYKNWGIGCMQKLPFGRYQCCGKWKRESVNMVTDRLCPVECTSSLLDVCIKLDSCPSGRCFNIIIWASFTFSLYSIGCLWAGSWDSESRPTIFLRAVSQIAIILWVLECKFCWFSMLDVLRDCLLRGYLKRWNDQYGVWILCF